MAYQVRVVLLVVLPELGSNRYNDGTIGGHCKDFIPEWLFQRQKMADLMLR